MTSVEKAMNLIEDCIEGYHYSHNNGCEIMFKRSEGYWKVRKLEEKSFWQSFDSRAVIAVFNRRGLNIGDFQAELHQNLITKAMYYNMQLKKLKRELSEETIQKGIKDWNQFGENLAKLIRKEVTKKNLRVVD